MLLSFQDVQPERDQQENCLDSLAPPQTVPRKRPPSVYHEDALHPHSALREEQTRPIPRRREKELEKPKSKVPVRGKAGRQGGKSHERGGKHLRVYGFCGPIREVYAIVRRASPPTTARAAKVDLLQKHRRNPVYTIQGPGVTEDGFVTSLRELFSPVAVAPAVAPVAPAVPVPVRGSCRAAAASMRRTHLPGALGLPGGSPRRRQRRRRSRSPRGCAAHPAPCPG